MSRGEEFDAGQGLPRYTRIPAGDPELAEHVGEKATLIEGPRRWRGTLGRHWQTNDIKLMIGKKSMRGIDDWRGHSVEVGPDAEMRFKHWKAHGANEPGESCAHCRRGTNPPGVHWP